MAGSNSESIFGKCTKVFEDIPGDFGGGSPVPKTFLMSFLAQDQSLSRYLELGVYRGKSLFPVAYSIYLNGGKTVGVDAYDATVALENDVPRETKIKIQQFFEELDIEGVFRELLVYKEQCGFGQTIEIIRKTSDSFFTSTREDIDQFDLIHIDANHDTISVERDYKNSIRHIKNGGFIVFDDIDWPSVDVVYQEAKRHNTLVFECENFGILLHEEFSLKRDHKVEEISVKLKSIFNQVSRVVNQDAYHIPSISVGVLTYNQVDTIEECLTSIVTQFGNFSLKVVVADDCSNDGTSELIQDFASNHSSDRISFDVIRNENNVGVMKNLENLIRQCKGSDYASFIEGDDLYYSPYRLSKHLELHEDHPDLTMSFNTLLLLEEKETESAYSVWDATPNRGTFTTSDLLLENQVGNLGAMFFNSEVLGNIEILCSKMFAGDWFISVACSQYGSVRKLNAPLNVYRKNKHGYWNSMSSETKIDTILRNLDLLNEHQNFSFDEEISRVKTIFSQFDPRGKIENATLLIIDDIFPHPGSGFRFAEFSEILNRIPGSQLRTTGESCHVLGKDSARELLVDYKRRNPKLANRVRKKEALDNPLAKLIYCDFLGNAYHNVMPLAESSNTPFIFTLYPNGMFSLNNSDSDKMLSRVMKSPQFSKVIVTQEITRDYLLQKNFCPPEKIEFIWGVVVPPKNLGVMVEKKRYGFEKQSLDLCFVAHQYTPSGSDKGFDTFLTMAKIISKKFDNVNFHIVGPWDKDSHEIEGIKNIIFYGVLSQEQLSKFYEDKDAIVSPNKPDQIFQGSFDGFPTAAVTDASLRKLAMITTDPLSLNGERFIDGKEIVITSNNSTALATNIEYFLQNPATLSSIADAGYKKSNYLYSVDRQLNRRIEIFEAALLELDGRPADSLSILPDERSRILGLNGLFVRLAKKFLPRVVQRILRKSVRLWIRLKTI